MRNPLTRMAAVALLLTCVSSAPAGDDKEARDIIAKSIQAMGGEAKLVKFQTMTWKEKGTYYGMGDGLPYTATCAMQWPAQFRMDIEGVFLMVQDGDKGWVKTGGKTVEMTKEEHAANTASHRAGWVASLVPLKDKAFQLTKLFDVVLDKQITSVVRVTRKDYPDVTLYFDKKTNLLVKSNFKTKSPELKFQEVRMEVFLSDYREVEGAQMPHKILMKRDDKLFVEAQMSDMRAPAKLDAKLFAKPAD